MKGYGKPIKVIDGELLNNSIDFIDKQKLDHLLKPMRCDLQFELWMSLIEMIEKDTDDISGRDHPAERG